MGMPLVSLTVKKTGVSDSRRIGWLHGTCHCLIAVLVALQASHESLHFPCGHRQISIPSIKGASCKAICLVSFLSRTLVDRRPHVGVVA
jgi:hypothetical protein